MDELLSVEIKTMSLRVETNKFSVAKYTEDYQSKRIYKFSGKKRL